MTVNVAIYTRQSVADDKEFGSLEAQRQAIESYVSSQPDWRALPEHYDDAGYSGGTTERPAFQQLLLDIDHGGIDVVACYKLDRLSRSINDFVRVTDLFERHNVRFVSVTQAFDTSTSLGRMTVNLLATFATYERDMIRERTRDKMAATRRRGLWTGGNVPIGYSAKDKRLVVKKEEADVVRELFQLYLTLRSTLAVAAELNRRGHRTKKGGRFTKQAVKRVLTNPVYVGKVRQGGDLYDGAHEAIIDRDTWEAVQPQFERNGTGGRPRQPAKSGALLLGLVRCGCGAGVTVHSSRRGNRRYASYVCQRYQKEGAASCPGSRVPAADLEAFVVDQIRSIGKDPSLVGETIAATRREVLERKPNLEAELKPLQTTEEKLSRERRNILDAIAKNGAGSRGLFEKLGEVETRLDQVTRRVEQVRAELAVLEGQVIDEDDLRSALASFDPVWDQLFPAEKARILQLIIEQVTYNACEGEVEITFRPGGVRALAKNGRRETA